MIKKLVVLLVLAVMFLSACSSEPPVITDGSASEPSSSKPEEKSVVAINPLTGVADLTKGKENDRPVAVMINNISVAQKVQTGVNEADIVYETEVEGGITRLMAVYQDISKVKQIGSVRSARYPYVDLALGHDAIYVHCGQDNTYCGPHLKDIDHISIDSDIQGAKRIKNGLATEHTLYAFGADLWSNLSSKFETKAKKVDLWQNFADTDTSISLADGVACKATVHLSKTTQTEFTFDNATKTYARSVKGTTRTDYNTGEPTKITNLFVLNTTITDYPDGYHRKVALNSGDGYFITNGTYQKINWKKGKSTSGFTFTDTAGNEITLNQGKSWVCLIDSSRPAPAFE